MVELWSHQTEAIKRAKELDGFGLFFEVGTGKTLTCIRMLEDKFKGSVKPTLIVCPPIVIHNWRREILKFTDIKENNVIPLTGSGKQREAKFDASPKKSIFITNYETLLMKSLFDKFLFWQPACLVLDESHKCKDVKSKRTKQAIRLADKAKHKFLLSGTPILNTMLDIFSQYRILDPKLFGRNFFTFRAIHFTDKNRHMPTSKHFPNWVPKDGAAKSIQSKIMKSSMFVEKEKCLDLPPLIRTTAGVELGKKQRRAYNDLKRDYIAYIDGGAAVAELAITKALRLQQIVSGHIPIESQAGKSVHIFEDNPRAKVLEQLLLEHTPGHKVIVWAVFKQNYKTIRDICDKNKIKYVECHGEKTATQKQENVDAFNNIEDVRVFIGHPASAGIGINLIPSDISIFYSRNFSLENDQQAEARNYRGGSERHKQIRRIDIVADETIDEQVMLALASKKTIGYNVLGSMKDKL